MQENIRYRISPGVMVQKLDEEMVLLQPDSGVYFTLNTIGTFMLERLNDGMCCSEVIQQTLLQYEAVPEQVEFDLCKLITDLQQHGLLA